MLCHLKIKIKFQMQSALNLCWALETQIEIKFFQAYVCVTRGLEKSYSVYHSTPFAFSVNIKAEMQRAFILSLNSLSFAYYNVTIMQFYLMFAERSWKFKSFFHGAQNHLYLTLRKLDPWVMCIWSEELVTFPAIPIFPKGLKG